MALNRLKNANRVIGIKQVTKSINKDVVESVFLGNDADARVIVPLKNLCEAKNILFSEEYTMAELGEACKIEVGAAAVAILK
ncbi:ribosomal L7Ae/L30e/S12e/Gadd45 family protein [Anaerosinus gibii]|uniref:Ribosomal L7Ae/L30e/S12e/Gadd45 family protein n=1 Tax=Selenobaculum gibii TaxID=3054208 RepID=A0A9Y2AHL7_9FIRM|nr:ribosomal L7Ae/L30e/S12e/Gadd45 family protein [Selenobaculum gbiensis]WIW70103.1 ribosomal L7Ae/L30e/S12e/Gadd45 family protein [Selenobaculum gbiensis]